MSRANATTSLQQKHRGEAIERGAQTSLQYSDRIRASARPSDPTSCARGGASGYMNAGHEHHYERARRDHGRLPRVSCANQSQCRSADAERMTTQAQYEQREMQHDAGTVVSRELHAMGIARPRNGSIPQSMHDLRARDAPHGGCCNSISARTVAPDAIEFICALAARLRGPAPVLQRRDMYRAAAERCDALVRVGDDHSQPAAKCVRQRVFVGSERISVARSSMASSSRMSASSPLRDLSQGVADRIRRCSGRSHFPIGIVHRSFGERVGDRRMRDQLTDVCVEARL